MAPQQDPHVSLAERAVGAAVGAAVKAAAELDASRGQLWIPERAKADIDLARLAAAGDVDVRGGFQEGAAPPEVLEALDAQGMDAQPPFGPGAPLRPYRELGDQPRNFDYRVGRNIAVTPRAGRISFATLKGIIDGYDIAQICIKHLINDVRSLPLNFIAADGVTDNVDDDIARAKAFFRKPDGQHTFRAWVAMYLNDMLRYDAGTLYKRRDRVGRLIALETISGTTIMPLSDYYGRVPTGDAPAYVQVVNGVPWMWLRNDALVYEPLHPATDSLYGTAPIEFVLLRANTDIRFQWYLLNRFTEGNVPAAFAEAPPDMSNPAAVTELQEAWDALMLGDQARKRQIRWVPAGSNVTPFREEGFDKEMALYLFRLTCAAYGVTPNDLGITDDVNRASGDTQVDVQYRVGPKPIVMHLEDLFNEVLQGDLGLRVQASFDEGEEKDDRLTTAQAWKIYVESGAAGLDEMREELLGLPVDTENPTPRFILTASGPVLLSQLGLPAGDIDPATAAPEPGAPLPLPAETGLVDEPVDEPVEPAIAAKGTELDGILEDATPIAAGLVVIAEDTGRILMLQRALDDEDPASGCWEFPGGCLEPDEQPLAAAWREWAEEVGQIVPPGRPAGMFASPNGVYHAYIWVIESEALVACNADERPVTNPDDPDGDAVETVAWMPLEHLPEFAGLRAEVAESTDWHQLEQVVAGLTMVAKATTVGIVSGTGIEGVDLAGADSTIPAEDQLPEDVRRLLAQWRKSARSRVAKGLAPRRFADVPEVVAAEVWPLLEDARSREDVDAAFAVAKGRIPKG